MTLLPDPGPDGKLNTDLEGQDDKADEAAVFAQNTRNSRLPGYRSRVRHIAAWLPSPASRQRS